MNKVLIIGGTGYLGLHLIEQYITKYSHNKIYILNRKISNNVLLKQYSKSITIINSSMNDFKSISHISNEFDTVINLSYVSYGIPFSRYKQTIFNTQTILKLCKNFSVKHYVEISSQSIFGYIPNNEMTPNIFKLKYGTDYELAKSHSEYYLLKNKHKYDFFISVIRPGNIIGTNSVAWTNRIIDLLNSYSPVGYIGSDGFTNATYVKNFSDYICHVSEQPVEKLEQFGNIHHLAEFSHVKWNKFILIFSEILNKKPKYISKNERQITLCNDFKNIIKLIGINTIGEYVLKSKALGSLINRILYYLPTKKLERYLINKYNISRFNDEYIYNKIDYDLLDILSTNKEFKSHYIKSWSPPENDLEVIINDLKKYLQDIGY